MITPLLGNQRFREAVSVAVREKRGMHTLVLEGPSGSGKKKMAQYYAAAMLCREGTPGEPCGKCRRCRAIEERKFSDVLWITPDKGKTGISVEQIRRLRLDATIAPVEAESKIYIFEDASLINTAGQNALLKLLEEPPEHTRFVLLTGTRSALLATILSRATLYTCEPLSYEDCVSLWKPACPEAEDAALREAFAFSGGYVGRGLEWFTAGDRTREAADRYFKALLERDEYALLTAGEALSAKGAENTPLTNSELPLFITAFKEKLLETARQDTSLKYGSRLKREECFAVLDILVSVEHWPKLNVATNAFFLKLTTAIAAALPE